ncbi:uncharacterized protein LOC134291497 [Aedes albopictus]|uniref:Retrotransposon gag domain-containing protein n=1 Tax=Aedes albopictus TaxID=7160 RepID=A0ABM1ZT86_AEDAL
MEPEPGKYGMEPEPGKYVRIMHASDEEDNTEIEQLPSESDSYSEHDSEPEEAVDPQMLEETTVSPPLPPPPSSTDRIAVVEKAIVDLAQLLLEKPWEKKEATKPPTEESAATWGGLDGSSTPAEPASAIRLDNIPSFPKEIPAGGMWEAFDHFIEKFEIAITLNSITDPTRQAKLLYLAIGDDLQTIVRAAGLRPSLDVPDCYRKMVNNISEYFHGMTDTAAEHEAFTKMKQESGESTMAFHARLMAKVQLCRYSPADQVRFVRTQLFNGMIDQELANQGRTFGYDAAYIVQAAARKEAFGKGTTSLPEGAIQAVGRTETPHHGNQRSYPSNFRARNFDGNNNQLTHADNQQRAAPFRRQGNQQPRRYGNGQTPLKGLSVWANVEDVHDVIDQPIEDKRARH